MNISVNTIKKIKKNYPLSNVQAAAEAYDAILDEQLDLVGADLLLKRARCHFALGRWLQAAADAGRAAKVAAEGDDDQVIKKKNVFYPHTRTQTAIKNWWEYCIKYEVHDKDKW